MEDGIVRRYEFLDNLEIWFRNGGMNSELARFSKVSLSLLTIAVLAALANFIVRKIIVAGLHFLTRRTKNTWNDFLVRRKVFHKLSHLAPALVIKYTIGIALYDYDPSLTLLIEKFTHIYIVMVCVLVADSFLSVLHDIYLTTEMSRVRPIKGYMQLAKIVIYVFGAIAIVSLILDKNPTKLLVGMGASAAVLMLVFRDTILGLVASVQVSVNNMVKPGDWIEMPGRNADGIVEEITLNTVKVQNWDRTISTIPTYALVSESFTNWKGMEESNGRRIKRSIFIDMRSVKFCSPELLEKLKRIDCLKDHIEQLSREIAEYNRQTGCDVSMPVNGRRMTNLGVFRCYLELYVKNNPKLIYDSTTMVRHLQPTANGLPVEIYCFSREKDWVLYEGVQADIFDHILAIVEEFELKIFQNPSGDDFRNLADAKQ